VTRGIDNIKKKRGEATTSLGGLQMKKDHGAPKPATPPPPVTFKLK
jgi:hypothetical protein